MSTCVPFILVEPLDWDRFIELQKQQHTLQGQDLKNTRSQQNHQQHTPQEQDLKNTRSQQNLQNLQNQHNQHNQQNQQSAWTDVYVGELSFTVQAYTPRTALYETLRKDDTPYSLREEYSPRYRREFRPCQVSKVSKRTCVLLFYKRVFYKSVLWRGNNTQKVVPMYGLRVADAFALQHNWNCESYREYFDGNSVRARLMHNLDDACVVEKPRYAFVLIDDQAKVGSVGSVDLVNSTPKKSSQLSFREIASAVVLFEECPITFKDMRLMRLMRSTRSTVTPTSVLVLKQIAIATNNVCDPGHTSASQEILVDFQVYCGNRNYIRVGDLCRQLAQHNLANLLPKTSDWPLRHIQPLLEQVATKSKSVEEILRMQNDSTEPACYVQQVSDIGFTRKLRIVREMRVRTFDVAKDVPVLHELLEHAVHGWKADKRYRFKSRKYEKQTDKPTGKALLVKTRLQQGWLDCYMPGKGQSVNHKWRKRCRLAKRSKTKKTKRFWKNWLVDTDCAFGLRKPRANVQHNITRLE